MLKRAINLSIALFRFELKATILHTIGVYKARKYQSQKHIKLHLACGENYKKGWINIDLFSQSADLLLDLRKTLPFKDNSCKEAYSEHFLEHLEYPHYSMYFLTEIKRVLKPKGRLTIVVPDSAWPMKSYFKGYTAPYFKITKEKKWHPKEYTTTMEHINYHFRQAGEHLYAYDEELLKLVLKNAGFIQIRKRSYNPKIDNVSYHPGSLYIIATKSKTRQQ